MDNNQPWNDFHFLNSAFSDTVSASGNPPWISASLVRFAYRGSRDKSSVTHRTVKVIDGLLVEYAVPFPLTYIFTPRVLQKYGSIFLWMLQVRRAKSVLERILVRDKLEGGSEVKVFYAMRSRLSWFVK
jgi:gamma-tubulin complex component 5